MLFFSGNEKNLPGEAFFSPVSETDLSSSSEGKDATHRGVLSAGKQSRLSERKDGGESSLFLPFENWGKKSSCEGMGEHVRMSVCWPFVHMDLGGRTLNRHE